SRTKIGKEISAGVLSRELRGGRIVKSSSHDRAANIVTVRIDRVTKARVRRRARPLTARPAIIRTRKSLVQLFRHIFTNVIDVKPARTGLKTKSKRIAKPKRPDGSVVSSSRAEERIISRDGAVGVKSQNLSKQTAQR